MMQLVSNLKSPSNRTLIVVVLSIFACTALLAMNSFFFSNFSWNHSSDEYVFINIATQMQNDLMPYRDMFDHKGPLLYFIYYIGLCIHGLRGIWLLQCATYFVTFVFIFRIARLVTTNRNAIIVLFLALCVFFYFGGAAVSGKPEYWSLPFIAMSLFYFYDYFKSDNWSYLRVLLVGICFGACLMMKATLASPIAVFGVYFIVNSIRRNRIIQLLKMLFTLFIGCLCVIIPFILCLAANNSLDSFFECYLLFNIFEYSANDSYSMLDNFLQMTSDKLVIAALLIQIYTLYKQRNRLDAATLICFILTLVFATSGSNYFATDLGMTSSLVLVWSLARLVQLFSFQKLAFPSIVASATFALVLMPLVLEDIRYDYNQLSNRGKVVEQVTYKNSEAKEIVDYIKNHSDKKDKIAVQRPYQNMFYKLADRQPALRYIYFGYEVYLHNNGDQEIASDLAQKKAKFIITSKNFTTNKYDKVYSVSSKTRESIAQYYEKVNDIAGSEFQVYQAKE